MAYNKLVIQVWCDWDPGESDLEEIGRHVSWAKMRSVHDRRLPPSLERPQDIEDEEAMRLFGGEEGDANLSQGERYP